MYLHFCTLNVLLDLLLILVTLITHDLFNMDKPHSTACFDIPTHEVTCVYKFCSLLHVL